MSSLLSIRCALISVFNKSKILNFAQTLSQYGVQLLSTTGTSTILSNHNLPVHKISDYTKFPEIMNGRLKTLHHKIYAGILNRTKLDDDIMRKYHFQSIDMLVIDLYPFKEISKNKQFSQEEILEYIDIGGLSMIRAAAKNYQNAVIIVDPCDYHNLINEMNQYNGSISLNTRFVLAKKAFQYVTQYDIEISNYFNNIQQQTDININENKQQSLLNYNIPHTLNLMHIQFTKKQNIRYGENPHQKAILYQETYTPQTNGSAINAIQLQGKPLSYNNIVDTDTALECVKNFNKPTCVIVKHATPCGVATSRTTITKAYKKAYLADPVSAFGGIIALNRNLDVPTVQAIIDNQHFVEVIIAPDIHRDCLKILSSRKNIRILRSGLWNNQRTLNIDFKRITNGLLIQDQDIETSPRHLEIVTVSQPTKEDIQNALFCWKIVKFVKSNAIVCAKNYQTTGISSGQTNRINAVKIATNFSKLHYNHNHKLQGSVMASDAFFTFTDGIHIAAQMGIRCIIQPGGSIKDSEIIKTVDQYTMSMIFTHTRHFRH